MGSTSERYVEMLRNFLRPQLRSLRVNMEEMWFQQDGATAHTARASTTVVRQLFPQQVVSRFGDVPWPPRSPDLYASDFFLWVYLKTKNLRSKTSYSRRSESFHSRRNCNCATRNCNCATRNCNCATRNCNCATRNVSKCDAGLWGEAPDACTARRTPSFRYNFP